MLKTLTDKANYFSRRAPNDASREDKNMRNNAAIEFQMLVLNMCYGNLEKCFD